MSAWLGIYWARWGDALLEAGLTPNQLQGQSKLDELFEGLAQAIRHYQKMPVEAELRMYRRINSAFPSHRTLNNRFKSKEEMLDAFRGWTSGKDGYSDILEFLPETAVVIQRASIARPKEGYVYLIASGKHYKIGRSDQLERRVKEIRIALPEAATLVHTIRTDDPPGIEAYWHRRFADQRANGEWFALTPQDVAAFKRRKYQ